MKSYVFALTLGDETFYREEMLAPDRDAAVALAMSALDEARLSFEWTLATLIDDGGREIWSVGQPKPTASDK